ncbi:MAG: methylenetetrahydrofolate reductase [NAD(P)H] [Hyphomicrobiaceae bacterium]|nr:methylenetetrahydrofolate reductase [NAD(P)H] [Hyphomicrobiaceae bacterium]MCC0024894.1 methylenetetrahydrofolate reductase [NAD(P)H] [Hyphomicrobiaceae bacterium]
MTFEAKRARGVTMSFEFFPPKTEAAEEKFWQSLEALAPLKPSMVSVTYGAGGSDRERTTRMVSEVKKRTGLEAAAHLTCVGASRDEVDEVVRGYQAAGINHIVALRGDPPAGIGERFETRPDGYRDGADLVAGIRKIGDFDISVAAYPEKHPESRDWQFDIDNLKRKVDAGANRAITQMFFDNADYWRFLDRCTKAGISVPIVPGIQPIHNFVQVSRFAAKCKARIPGELTRRFEGVEAGTDLHGMLAAATAAQQVTELLEGGVTAFHFFTMNRSELVIALARLLGH